MITQYSSFGKKIKSFRNKKRESLTQTAKNLQITKSYLSKIENGHIKPNKGMIDKLASYFSLQPILKTELLQLSGFNPEGIVVKLEENNRKEVLSRVDQNVGGKEAEIVIPSNIPVLYTDSIFVTKNEFGIVLDFAQRLGPTAKHTVVARLGMSEKHAKALLDVLNSKLNDKLKVIMQKVAIS